MAIKTKEEILESLRGILGDNTSDEALAFTEDLSDTLGTSNGDNTDWKSKYEENDKQWRERYRNRFFGGSATDDSDDGEPANEPKKPMTFEDLFKEE